MKKISKFRIMKFEKTWMNKRYNFVISTPIDGTCLYLKISIKTFQAAVASGKKLFMYLFDLKKSHRKVSLFHTNSK